ncbi:MULTISPECIES: MFS transporter [unclassified Synechococcus]|uniref:MFS transporter n=1 Tax=unclassified Synechococcus TaxID=2626047 RepID=UPI0020CBC651|nr:MULTISPECIES: MFS transporter [unclassified Synechococcus]
MVEFVNYLEHGTLEKKLQDHIDETPPRPLSSTQWSIWGLAAAGKLFEGMVVFLTGVALPLIEKDLGLPATLRGAVGAATLFGILIGASLFGNLADRLGRKFVFVLEMALFTGFIGLRKLWTTRPHSQSRSTNCSDWTISAEIRLE